MIRIASGPLMGMEGRIIKIDARRFRAKVQITLLGEPREVELGINLLANLNQNM